MLGSPCRRLGRGVVVLKGAVRAGRERRGLRAAGGRIERRSGGILEGVKRAIEDVVC